MKTATTPAHGGVGLAPAGASRHPAKRGTEA